jgi:glycine C-acetyltransferase
VIVTDGVFSMDGDIAPLPKIVELAKKYDAFTFVDECHATGIFGAHGRGTDEYFGLRGEIDVISSTLGKALGGGTGGYTAGPKEMIEVLRNKGRPYLFSNSICPSVAGASIEVFNMLNESTELQDKLRKNTAHFRKGMKAAGFNIMGADATPICPVLLGDAKLGAAMADELMNEHDIYVISFSFPVVAKGQARIRCQLSGAHSPEQIEHTINAFTQVGKKFGVI